MKRFILGLFALGLMVSPAFAGQPDIRPASRVHAMGMRHR